MAIYCSGLDISRRRIEQHGHKKRDELNRLIRDCKLGKIDRIITKSVSRFARNTQELLVVLRSLKEMGVSIYFEEQGIDSDGRAKIVKIKNITTNDLRHMGNSEGLILQGCGGDLQEWMDGINEILTQEGILRNGSQFKECSTFEHDGLTCLLFPFKGVGTDLGRLAIWRLKTHDAFGDTWLSDYVPNRLGGFYGNQQEEPAETEEDEDFDSGMSMK